MLLYANGCSMTLGDEMSDPSRTCFPTLVAEHFGFDLHNDAHSGASNCRILRTTLLWLADYLGKGGGFYRLELLLAEHIRPLPA